MENETLIRASSDTAAPPEPKPEPAPKDDAPTECGLTRAELRAIVAEIIG